MKILLALFLAMVFIFVTMEEAHAKNWLPLGERGRLLSDANSLGRKVNIGTGADQNKGSVAGNKESDQTSKTSGVEAPKNSEDDKNNSYGNFGRDQSGSSTDTHRFFPCVARSDCSKQ